MAELMSIRKYWPLDMDPEGQIYDNLAWDLPGYRRRRPQAARRFTRQRASGVALVAGI